MLGQDPFVAFGISLLLFAGFLVLVHFFGLWRVSICGAVVAAILNSSIYASAFGSSSAFLLVVFSLLLLAGIADPSSRSSQPPPAGLRWLILMACVAVASVVWSVASAETLSQSLAFLVVVWVISRSGSRRWANRDHFYGDLMLLASIGVIVAGAGLLVLATQPSATIGSVGRYQGILLNPNYAGILAVMSSTPGIWLWKRARATGRVWLAFGFVVNSATLLMCGSRGAILAIVAGVISLVLVSARARLVSLVGFPLLAGGIIFLMLESVSLDSVDRTSFGADLFSGRLEIWESAIYLWAEHPWFGMGFGAAQAAPELRGFTAHNLYIGTLLELGVVGFVLLVAVTVCALAVVRRVGRPDASLIAVPVAFVVSQQFEASTFGFGGPVAVFSWIVLGMAISARRTSVARERSLTRAEVVDQ